jgi:hypothetical protein
LKKDVSTTKGLHIIEGHIYAIEWVDSGRDYNGAGIRPENADLCVCITYGKILRFDEEEDIICIGTSICDDDPSFENTEYVAIDLRNVVSAARLVESKRMEPEDEVD